MAAIVLVIVLVIWGPGKLGDIGGALGRGLREFKKASSETKDQFTSALKDSDETPVVGSKADETKETRVTPT
jgi:sec-independent protein translocase protein TatA